MSVMQEAHKKAQAFEKEAKEAGNHQEIMPKMMKMRQEHEGKIEAFLTDAQKKQWKEMLGKPFKFED